MADQNIGSQGVLFPTGSGTNLSHTFAVRDKPVALKAFNLPEGVELIVEMGANFGCDLIWGPFRPNCCLVKVTHERNVIILGVTGTYRVFINDPNDEGYDDLVVLQHVADSFYPLPSHCGCDEEAGGCDCRLFPAHLGNDEATTLFHAPETV